MRSFVGIIIIILFVACTRNKSVLVSGRVETGDTVVYFQVNDSLHKFRLDEKHYFSGKIELEKGTYARFIPYSIQVFLTPGEDLEISMNNVRNVSNSLQFKGTLSAINTYLKEQQNRYFIYDPNLYKLNEKDFVNRMRENINTNIVLIEITNHNILIMNIFHSHGKIVRKLNRIFPCIIRINLFRHLHSLNIKNLVLRIDFRHDKSNHRTIFIKDINGQASRSFPST